MANDINVGLRLSTNMGDTLSQIRNVSSSFEGMSRALSVLGAARLTRELSAATMQASNTNREFARMQNTSGKTDEQIQALQRHAQQLAVNTGISADNLTGAFNTLASSGLGVDGVKNSVEAISLAALSAGANIDQLAEALNTISRNFDIDLNVAGSAENILDQISATIAHSSGNFTFDDLVNFAQRNAQRVSQAGLSLPEFLNFTQAVSNTVPNVAEAKRQIEYLLQTITGDSLHNMGIETFDNLGNRLGFNQILQNIAERFNEYAENDQWEAHFINTAFGGNRYIATLIRQMQENSFSQDLKTGAEYLENASGRLRRDAENAGNNLATQIERLQQIINRARNNAGNFTERMLGDTPRNLVDSLDENPALVIGGVAAGAATLAGVTYALSRLAKGKGGAIGNILGSGTNLGAGVIQGRLLEQVGVQPVFVVNMPSGGLGGPNPLTPNPTAPVNPRTVISKAGAAAPWLARLGSATKGAVALPIVPVAIAGGAIHQNYTRRNMTREERDYLRLQNNPRASEEARANARRRAEVSRQQIENQRTDVYVHIEAAEGLVADHVIEDSKTLRWFNLVE